MQLHKAGATATIYTKNGADYTSRFPAVAAAIGKLPAPVCIIDGELIAADKKGQPDFRALLHASKTAPVCVYAFDLLQLGGKDLRGEPLESRREALSELLARAKTDLIRFSESFAFAETLLEECARLGFEGIVCKRKDAPYRIWTSVGLDQGQD